MADSIYGSGGASTFRSSRVSLKGTNSYATTNVATFPIVQSAHAPERKYSASISATGGNVTVVSAISGYSIVVDSYVVSSTGASTFRFLSNTGTNLTGAMALSANGSVSISTESALRTVSGEALVINTSGGIVGGSITYRIV